MVMLAIHLSAVKILEYIFDQYIMKSQNPMVLRQKLLFAHDIKGGVYAPHLAAIVGNLDVLRILKFKYDADFLIGNE